MDCARRQLITIIGVNFGTVNGTRRQVFGPRKARTLLAGTAPLSCSQAARAEGRMRGTGGAWPRGRAQSLRRAAHLSGYVELAGSRGRRPPRGPRTHLTQSRSNIVAHIACTGCTPVVTGVEYNGRLWRSPTRCHV